MKVLICDDEQEFLDILKKHIQAYMCTHFITSKIEATTCPLAVLQGTDAFDLAFWIFRWGM